MLVEKLNVFESVAHISHVDTCLEYLLSIYL